MATTSDPAVRDAIIEFVKAFDVSVLQTVDENGYPSARPMADEGPDEDFVFWFSTGGQSAKMAHIRATGRVGIHYYNTAVGPGYVHVAADCTIEQDQQAREAHFREEWLRWWPEGPSAPDYILLRCKPVRVVYWAGDMGSEPVVYVPSP